MKRFFLFLALVPLAILLIPVLTFLLFSQPAAETVSTSSYLPPTEITVLETETGKVHTLQLEDCVNTLLTQELLSSAPLEAAKAQAVATRSYLLSLIAKNTHTESMLCNDGSHCVAFPLSSPTTIHPAVQETSGEFLSYQGLPAKACYFHVSAGYTESSADVWGVEIPYLVSVPSKSDAQSAAYQSRVFYPLDAFYTVLKGARHNIDTNQPNIGKVNATKHGHVKEIQLLGQAFTGQEVQSLFHLKSTNFTTEVRDNQIVFTVKGDGHGVGMSKYGAKIMAENGEDYTSILSHYYPKTDLQTTKRES